MRVTAVEEWSRSRSRVFVDEEFAFVLYKGELRSYHICEGKEIAEEDYRGIMTELLPKRAKLRAMNLLKIREYTRKQLYRKLKEGCYPERVIEEALAYVESFRYIDDLRYASDYIACHEDRRSRRRIEQELAEKGIDRETRERAWRQWEEQGGRQDEQAMIRRLLEKRGYEHETADGKECRKTFAFLMRKGFSEDAVRRALQVEES